MTSTTLWLDADAQAAIEAEARVHRLKETGGALFGYETAEGDVVVTQAFGPGPKARHRRFRLVSDRAHTQRLINEIFASSEGRERYIGEWHSHPLGEARLSGKDVETLDDIASQEKVELDAPIALIQETKPLRRRVGIGELGAFQWHAEEQRLERLSIRAASRPDQA